MLFLEDTQSQINSARNILKKKIIKDYLSINPGLTFKDAKENKELATKTEEILNTLLSITEPYQDKSIPNNPAINQAHLPFLANFYNEGKNLDLIKFYYDKFLKTPKIFKNKDVFKDFHSFERTIDANQEIDQSIKSEEINELPIYEDENIKVFLGNSLDKCVKYGQGEKYGLCISRLNKTNNLYHYYRKEQGLTTYFVYFQNSKKEPSFMIVDATNDPEVFSYNIIKPNDDISITKDDLISNFPFLENAINRNVFRSIPIEGKEKEFYDKFYDKSITSLDSVEDQLTFLSFHMEVSENQWRVLIGHSPHLEILVKTAIENDYTLLPSILWEKFPKLKERYFVKVRRKADIMEKEIREKVVHGVYKGDIRVVQEILPNLSDLILEGSLDCRNCKLTNLKGSPKIIKGNFDCSHNSLTTLEGSPESISKDFSCNDNELTSLKGGPKIVGNIADIADNKLTSLEGSPETVGDCFFCDNNELTSLEGAPESVGGHFFCDNNKLTSLKGAPKTINGNFRCHSNELTTLEDGPESVWGTFNCSFNELTTLKGGPTFVKKDYNCFNNKLTSLEGSPESINGDFDCRSNRLKSLKGGPKEVGVDFGDFYCDNNLLTNLKGSPEKINGHFTCVNNLLVSLKGAPKYVGGDFECRHNKLRTLSYLPYRIYGKVIHRENPVDFTYADVKNAQIESKKRENLTSESFKYYFIHTKL